MHPKLVALAEKLKSSEYREDAYSIDTLSNTEAYCIYDSQSEVEVFYYEKGIKTDLRVFSGMDEAIEHYLQCLARDKAARKSRAT